MYEFFVGLLTSITLCGLIGGILLMLSSDLSEKIARRFFGEAYAECEHEAAGSVVILSCFFMVVTFVVAMIGQPVLSGCFAGMAIVGTVIATVWVSVAKHKYRKAQIQNQPNKPAAN
ncbi:MAG: hypothetical protein LBU20_01905 [Candidatus Nomurabacteria bacterium]|jgi:uncharacterized YccA/Bax inhibitor family protein|nr:hypothetical protein [Candidatus Nomurabacteria bacterium]